MRVGNFVTVGIFWFFTPTHMVSYEQKRDISLLEDFDMGIAIFDKQHEEMWSDVQNHDPMAASCSYDSFPRGRLCYDIFEDCYVAVYDKYFESMPNFREQIAKRFCLSMSDVVWQVRDDYNHTVDI